MFGANLASRTVAATTTLLPTVLAGRRLTSNDRTGTARPAPLLFVSSGQINCLIPAGLNFGARIIRVEGPRLLKGRGEVVAQVKYRDIYFVYSLNPVSINIQ